MKCFEAHLCDEAPQNYFWEKFYVLYSFIHLKHELSSSNTAIHKKQHALKYLDTFVKKTAYIFKHLL